MSRHRSGEALIFGIATVLILVHRLDDAFVHRGRGLGQDTLAAAIASPPRLRSRSPSRRWGPACALPA